MASSNISVALQWWKDFDLHDFQVSTEKVVEENTNRADASIVSRKELMTSLKALMKTIKEKHPDVKPAVAPFIKVVQKEIDSLTKRSTGCEAEFFKIYKKISEIPDPQNALMQAEAHQKKNHKLNDLEIENAKLRDTLAEYHKEFAEVKNQGVTIKNLREKVKSLEKESESNALKIIEEKQSDLQKEFALKEKQMVEDKLQAATKLTDAERKIQSLQMELEASRSEFFNLKSRNDEEVEAKQAEIDMLVSDLDRCNQTNDVLQKQCESLQEEMQLVKESACKAVDSEKLVRNDDSHLVAQNNLELELSTKESACKAVDSEKLVRNDDSHLVAQNNLELELSTKEREVQQLVEDVKRLQSSLIKNNESTSSQINKLEEELQQKTEVVSDMQKKLAAKNDYDEIKKELNIIKETEFSSNSEDLQKPLEQLLIEKNKVLQDENTVLRNSNSKLNNERNEIVEKLETLQASDEQKSALITSLESDLMLVQAPIRSAADGSPANQNTLSSNSSHEVIAGALKDSSVAIDVESLQTSQKDEQSSMLVVVKSQRERFRVRSSELEAENYNLHQQLQTLQSEVSSMRGDNVKLYEKIKYLQSYSGRTNAQEDKTSRQYSHQYEANLDPFASFSRREKQRKYLNLSAHEKVTLQMTRMILNSKVGRTVFFFYALFMHFLLYVVLYKYAYVDDCKHHIADLCYKKFGAQMSPGN